MFCKFKFTTGYSNSICAFVLTSEVSLHGYKSLTLLSSLLLSLVLPTHWASPLTPSSSSCIAKTCVTSFTHISALTMAKGIDLSPLAFPVIAFLSFLSLSLSLLLPLLRTRERLLGSHLSPHFLAVSVWCRARRRVERRKRHRSILPPRTPTPLFFFPAHSLACLSGNVRVSMCLMRVFVRTHKLARIFSAGRHTIC